MTVIRKAIIEIETHQKRSKLEAPDIGPSERAFKAESKAAAEAAKEIDNANKTLAEHAELIRQTSNEQITASQEIRPVMQEAGRTTEEFGVKSVQSFAKAGRGALQLTRAIALFAASNEQDTQRILQGLISIEVGVSAVGGAYKLLSSSVLVGVAASLTPVTATILAIGTALTAGAAAWKYWGDSAQDAANRAKTEAKNAEKAYVDLLSKIEQAERGKTSRRTADEAFTAETAITPEAKRAALILLQQAKGTEFSRAEQKRAGLEATDTRFAEPGVKKAHLTQLVETEKTELGLVEEKARIQRELLDLEKAERQQALQRQNDAAQSLGKITSFFGLGGSQQIEAANRIAADKDIKQLESDAQTSLKLLTDIFGNINSLLEKHETALQGLQR